jgi:hypothetical protein
MTVFTWKGEDTIMTQWTPSLLQTFSTIWTYGYGTSNW